jgi:hypothetical protein
MFLLGISGQFSGNLYMTWLCMDWWLALSRASSGPLTSN